MNELRKVLETASNAKVIGEVLEMVDTLHGKVSDFENAGKASSEVDALIARGERLIIEQLTAIVDREKKRLQAELDERRKKYEDEADRRVTRRALALQEATLRYGAMSGAELKAELETILSAEFVDQSPAVLDALQTEARTVLDSTEVDAFREQLRKKRYREPWIQDAKGRDLVTELELYSGTRAREIPVTFRERGKLKSTRLGFREIMEDTRNEE